MQEILHKLALKRHKKLLLKLPFTKQILNVIVDNQLKTRNYKDLREIAGILSMYMNSNLHGFNQKYCVGMIRELENVKINDLHELDKFYASEGFPLGICKSKSIDNRFSSGNSHRIDTESITAVDETTEILTMQYHLSRFNYHLAMECLKKMVNANNLEIFYTYFILNSCSSLPKNDYVYQVDYAKEISSILEKTSNNSVSVNHTDTIKFNDKLDISKIDPQLYTQITTILSLGKPGKYDRKVSTKPLLYTLPPRLDHDPLHAIDVFMKMMKDLDGDLVRRVIVKVHAKRLDVEVLEGILDFVDRDSVVHVVEMYKRLGEEVKAELFVNQYDLA